MGWDFLPNAINATLSLGLGIWSVLEQHLLVACVYGERLGRRDGKVGEVVRVS